MAATTLNQTRKHRDGHGGAIKPYVQKNARLPPVMDDLIAQTVRAVLVPEVRG